MAPLAAPPPSVPPGAGSGSPRPSSPVGSHHRRPGASSASHRPIPADAPLVLVYCADPGTVRSRVEALGAVGLRVLGVGTRSAANRVLALGVDAVVLDRQMPDGDALVLVDQLYHGDQPPRIVVIASSADDRERVEGLGAGADDVVPPTVSMAELVARVRRLLAPVTAATDPIGCLEIGRVSIDQDRRLVQVDGADVGVSPTQFQILVTLARSSGQPVAVRVLVERCWDPHQDRATCALRPQVARLRRALRDAVVIRAIRGTGYCLTAVEAGAR